MRTPIASLFLLSFVACSSPGPRFVRDVRTVPGGGIEIETCTLDTSVGAFWTIQITATDCRRDRRSRKDGAP
jgi:hypothetical protein